MYIVHVLNEKIIPMIITGMSPHMTHKISPVSEAFVTLRTRKLPLVGQTGGATATSRGERRGDAAFTSYV